MIKAKNRMPRGTYRMPKSKTIMVTRAIGDKTWRKRLYAHPGCAHLAKDRSTRSPRYGYHVRNMQDLAAAGVLPCIQTRC